jgi:hypothetical protein
MVNRKAANDQRHAGLERMRIKPVSNSHHEIISGSEKSSTLIVTDSTDLCRPSSILSHARFRSVASWCLFWTVLLGMSQ